MNLKTIDDLLLSKVDELVDVYWTVYKADNKQYRYWAKELLQKIEDNTKIAARMLQDVNNIYIKQIEIGGRQVFKNILAYKDLVDINYAVVKPEIDAGLFEIYFTSALAGAAEFKKKVGVVTTFSAADGPAIDYYKYLTEQRGAYLLDTDKKRLANLLRKGNTQGLTLREIKKSIVADLSDVNKIAARAHNIATTETTVSLNWSKYNSGIKATIKMLKTWFTAGDKQVRPSHIVLDGITIKMEEFYTTGLGSLCSYPGDANLPAADVVGCRCSFGMGPA